MSTPDSYHGAPRGGHVPAPFDNETNSALSPRFSLVIPTFNYGRFLRRAIDSAIAQEGDDYEVLIVDDGSTDDTAQIVASYGDRVRFESQSNQGPALACRRGLTASRGDYLIFFDADDRLRPDALTHLRDAVEAYPEARMIYGRYHEISDGGAVKESPAQPPLGNQLDNFRNYLQGKLSVCTGAAVMHRDVFARLWQIRNPPRHGMDIVAIAQTFLHYPCRYTDHVLLEVYAHNGRLRENIDSIRSDGLQIIEILFHPQLMRPDCMRYKRDFVARVQRERTRSFYRARSHEEAWCSYQGAVAARWASLGDTRNLRRACSSLLKIQIRRWAGRPVQSAPPAEPAVDAMDCSTTGRFRSCPPPHWLFGHRHAIDRDPLGFLLDCATRYGDVVPLKLGRKTFLLNNSRDIQHVLLGNPENYHRSGIQVKFLPVLGDGLLSSEPPLHQQHRSLLQPSFHRKKVAHYAGPTLDATRQLLERWRDGQVIDLKEEMLQLASSISGSIVLGITQADRVQEFTQAVQLSHQRAIRKLLGPVDIPKFVPTRTNVRLRRYVAGLDAAIYTLIEEQRRRPSETPSLLGELLELQRRHGPSVLSDRQVRDHCLTMFLAAYEPLSNALAWAFYETSRHPVVSTRLQAEIDRVCGHRLPACKDLPALEYTSLVFAETLRLHPSVSMLARRTVNPDSLPSGAMIPRGADVWISPYVIHRSEEHFPEPERFDPERFRPKISRQRSRYVYIPFGIGPRACIGEPLARMQASLIMAAISGHFRMKLATDQPIVAETVNRFTMQPASAIPVLLAARRWEKTPANPVSAA